MSRSGYSDEIDDQQQFAMYRGRVTSATRGKRGQAFFKALAEAMDAMPGKVLIANELQNPSGNVCAIGALGAARGIDMSVLDPDDSYAVAATFNIAEVLARETVYMNDEGTCNSAESPSARWERMRGWISSQINADPLT